MKTLTATNSLGHRVSYSGLVPCKDELGRDVLRDVLRPYDNRTLRLVDDLVIVSSRRGGKVAFRNPHVRPTR